MDFDDKETEFNDEEGDFIEDLNLFNNDKQDEYFTMRDSVVFLVDVLSENFEKVLGITERFLKSKVISNENDLFTLVFYNSIKTNNEYGFEGVDVAISKDNPSADLIKKNKSLMLYYENQIKEDKHYDCVSLRENSLNEALWISQNELNKDLKSSLANSKTIKRIFLFTSRDNPMTNTSYAEAIEKIVKDKNTIKLSSTNIKDMSQEKIKTIQKVKDLMESNIIIEIFPISQFFDIEKFYYEIISFNSEEDRQTIKELFSPANIKDKLKEISRRITKRDVKKRTLGKIPFNITKNVSIEVNLYCLIGKARKSKSDLVDMISNKQLSKLSRILDTDTGDIVNSRQIETFHEFGKTKITFSYNDVKKIKTIEPPSLSIIGFKSNNFLKTYYNVKNSYFIYPNEYYSVGSSRVLDAMINQLISKNKIGIAKLVAREGGVIRLCALIPQKENYDENYFQTPPGFHIIFLPFAEDIRKNETIISKIPGLNININNYNKNKNKPNSKEIELMKSLIKKMSINFDPKDIPFDNFYLQKFYAVLEAKALEEEGNLQKIKDKMITKDEDIMHVLGDNLESDILENFGNLKVFGKPKKEKKEKDDSISVKNPKINKKTKNKKMTDEEIEEYCKEDEIEEASKEFEINVKSNEKELNNSNKKSKKTNKSKEKVVKSKETKEIKKKSKNKTNVNINDDLEDLEVMETLDETYKDVEFGVDENEQHNKITVKSSKKANKFDDELIRNRILSNNLDEFTVDELQSILKLKEQAFTAKMKKKQLIEKVIQIYNKDN